MLYWKSAAESVNQRDQRKKINKVDSPAENYKPEIELNCCWFGIASISKNVVAAKVSIDDISSEIAPAKPKKAYQAERDRWPVLIVLALQELPADLR